MSRKFFVFLAIVHFCDADVLAGAQIGIRIERALVPLSTFDE